MKSGFRQSMSWLHTWAGLMVGWLLFFIFLTGTFGYVDSEVDLWMQPEQMPVANDVSSIDLLPLGLGWLSREKADAQSWYLYLPEGGRRGQNGLEVGWRTWPEGDNLFGQFARLRLEPETGQSLASKGRETRGGNLLYKMHYELHYIPYNWAVRIVGMCTMFMLVAILSGIIVHRKLFADFFTFRPARGQRSWLDGHNLLSVTALPFLLMITWSGLIFFLFIYMPVAGDTFFPEGVVRDRFYAEVLGTEQTVAGSPAPMAEQAPLEPMLAELEQRWGKGTAGTLRIENVNRENAEVLIYTHRSTNRPDSIRQMLKFDGVSGELLSEGPNPGTIGGKFRNIMLGLHEGLFAGPVLRLLYVLSGLAGTAMIGTGLLLWSAKRKTKLKSAERPNFGIAAVDVLNLGTIIGLPIGIAAYFWANRLLPVGMEWRADWEANAMFITWGLTYLYAIWRSLDRAWLELCALAAVACGFIPILNALTTDRGFVTSMAHGDWVFAGFDLSAVVAGIFFAWLSVKIWRKQQRQTQAHSGDLVVAVKPVSV